MNFRARSCQKKTQDQDTVLLTPGQTENIILSYNLREITDTKFL